MAKQTVNIGTSVNDGSGDPARTAFNKLNQNDTELYDALGANASGVLPSALPIAKGGTGASAAEAARTNLGLGTAATREVGTNTGDVMAVGAFGLGGTVIPTTTQPHSLQSGAFVFDGGQPNLPSDHANGYGSFGLNIARGGVGAFLYMPYSGYQNNFILRTYDYTGVASYRDHVLRDSRNTTVDANGFVKAASPIVKLFADKIELNDEAQQQEITFKKLGVGDYLIKGSTGFAQDGWHIETPKDANGNVLFSVIYTTLENGDISVKTYKKRFDLETASIVADLTQPVEITANRWIDLRLQEIEVTDDPEQ